MKTKGIEFYHKAKDFYGRNKNTIHKIAAAAAVAALGLPQLAGVFDAAFTAVDPQQQVIQN